MKEKLLFRESVRGIVEYVLKSGSLDDRFISRGRAIDGTIAHGKLQKDNLEIYENYEKEVRMQHEFQKENIILLVEGRAVDYNPHINKLNPCKLTLSLL